jgi:hypothetical protein
MKLHSMLWIVLLCGLATGDQSRLSPRFQTVFVLSMANSLDQHLASRLTSSHVLWVVLQPSSADAVLTDTLDTEFWEWLDRTFPAPAGVNRDAYRGTYPTSGRHRGTVFLIDPRKRLVLWSTYELPRNSSPGELDRSASRITNQLRVAFGKK